jgi:hypothetical protein
MTTITAGFYDVAEGYTKPIVTLDVMRRFGSTDCTNGGISSHFNTLLLFPAETQIAEIDPRQRPCAVRINVRIIGGPVYSIEPVDRRHQLAVGPMMGGNYAATSDSRFASEARRVAVAELIKNGWPDPRPDRFYGAMAVHDRFETQAQYDALSR